ncbi:MAG: SpoIIE family protein phosphatase [Acidimicrobiales bacterium]
MNPEAPDHGPGDQAVNREAGDTTAERLRLALLAGGLGVWEWDRRTDTVEWDEALEEIFGLAPGEGPTDFDSYLALLHPEDVEVVGATVAEAIDTGTDFTVEHRVVCPDGETKWVQGRGHPIVEDGEVVGLVGVTGDVTERHEAEAERTRLLAEESAARADAEGERARLRFLIEAKAALSEHLGLEDQLDELARLSIPRFADGSAVHLLDEAGEPELVSLHHRDPQQVEVIRQLFDRYPVRLDNTVGIGAVIREGRSGWLPEATEEMLARAAESEHHLQLLRRLDLTAGLVVPLVGPDGTFGAITFITTGGRRLAEDDLDLVEQLCSRVAVLVRNAQLLESRELERAAHRYQAALLQSMFEASVDGVLAVGTHGEVLAYNQRFLHLWDLDEDLVDRGDDALLAEAEQRVADREGFVASVKAAYEDRPDRMHDEVELANGRILDRHGTCLTGPDGEYLGFLWNFRDVTLERAQAAAVAEAGKRSAMLARTLQQSLLPPRLPRIPGIDLAARYHPAFEGLDIGGDFYDVFTVGDDWILVIGDVCGKGAEAASLTALARYTIRATSSHDSNPTSILTELNSVMLADADSTSGVPRFATVGCIRLRDDPSPDAEPGTILADVACGGHPPPLLVRHDRTIEDAGQPGTLLGVFAEVQVTTVTNTLHAGDALVCVTDGVLEARDAEGNQFEVDGMQQVLGPLAGRSAGRMCAELEAAALEVQDGVAHDDIAILVARVEPQTRLG